MKKFDINKAVDNYLSNGYAIVNFFSPEKKQLIDDWAFTWLYSLMPSEVKGNEISNYHNWFEEFKINHDELLRAKNRHKLANKQIDEEIIQNSYLKEFCRLVGVKKYKFWDEGLGNIGFRLIRPGYNDGYPFSKKEWGVAKNVISLWIPIVGYSENETLLLLPESHKKDFIGEIDQTNKFRNDELRLASISNEMKFIRPSLKENELLIFHPKLIHSEDVLKSNITRFNLEMRIEPIYE